jgi:hypothetical protein
MRCQFCEFVGEPLAESEQKAAAGYKFEIAAMFFL